MSEHGRINMCEINCEKERPKAQNPLMIEDLSLRDGHQSLFATRGRTEDMIPVAERMDEVGFWAMEVWGGATFDTMHRFLNEDPWERIRTLKRYIKKTPFSMLLRGQNLVGYRNYADDVAKAFVNRAAENGMDVFRTFDALNDYRNFEAVAPVIKSCGKHFQGCICYSLTEPRMGGTVYTLDYYVKKAKDLESMGADSICIKDMAGLMAPYDAFDLVKALKANVDIPINLHSHFTSGMAAMTHLKAAEAGVDILDTCLTPYAYRTSHPALEPLVMSLIGTDRDTGFDIETLASINETLEKDILPKYRHLLDDTKVSVIDINVLLHQTPGGMLSNLVNQLRDMDALDRIGEVYEELPRVRKELGQIPLVTPTSQIVGTQTVNNVLFDTKEERYKMITAQVKDLCYGLYGKTAAPIDPEVQKKALKGYDRGENPITCRPAEVLKPELEDSKAQIKDLAVDEDDLILYTLFPVTGKKFLQQKYGKEAVPESMKAISLEDVQRQAEMIKKAKAGELVERKVNGELPEKTDCLRTFNVFVDEECFEVGVDEVGGTPVMAYAQPAQGTQVPTPPPAAAPAPAPAAPEVKPAPAPKAPKPAAPPAAQPAAATGGGAQVTAPMPGMIIKYEKNVGDFVKKGDTVVVLEAMKMENALPAPADGEVTAVNFGPGDSVSKGEILAVIG
ncbi:oxaloacetate decarboxylase, alpha subunit/pyruvate carboxylase subunit B [Desulfocicer vacuolatum DSM 3385]|uniref:Oxaloacetate decarboxylase, alpha subunit/pyruvate carboxylase subunit B n=1 Tax=Desulfocicer vacuolatum DSM 3385 TaxID=1121400 RepID=A0A1W2EAX2_9BACT|nr:pyruvate carboxylase subunit B [Desulfocicer vacuolatum]SMD06496.1 oxaloacetate decarboxylase, alpha subunit/pyruvate carboxylase subunit B [Desulfocicer vacuolatum DSM 3385]